MLCNIDTLIDPIPTTISCHENSECVFSWSAVAWRWGCGVMDLATVENLLLGYRICMLLK